MTIPAKSTQANGSLSIIILMSVVMMTWIHWIILIYKLPVLSSLPYWFFNFRDQPILIGWVVVAAAALIAAIGVNFSQTKGSMKLVCFIVLGSIMQFSFAVSKGQGLDGLRDRMVHTGHAQFATVAVQQDSMLETTRRYEELVNKNALGQYAPSKPPGTLMLYMLTERLAHIIRVHDVDATQRLDDLRTFASFTWPICSYLVLILMFQFSRDFLSSEQAGMACLFYMSIPSMNLITLHTDQVFFPLLAFMPFYVLFKAYKKNRAYLALLSGVFFYVAMFFSFGLMLIALEMMALFIAMSYQNKLINWRLMVWYGVAMVLGFALSDLVARVGLNYNVLTRYMAATTYHVNWKGWDGTLSTMLLAGLTNFVEFSVFLGLPLSILSFVSIGCSIHHVRATRCMSITSAVALALPVIFLMLLALSKTKAETARIWMFLMPFICIVAAQVVSELYHGKKRQLAFMVLMLALQFGTTYVTLRNQDFM